SGALSSWPYRFWLQDSAPENPENQYKSGHPADPSSPSRPVLSFSLSGGNQEAQSDEASRPPPHRCALYFRCLPEFPAHAAQYSACDSSPRTRCPDMTASCFLLISKLCNKVFQTPDRNFQVIQRIRIGNTQEAFPAVSKCRPRHDSHLLFLQKACPEFFRRHSELLNAREHVGRSLRLKASQPHPLNLMQKVSSSLIIRLSHLLLYILAVSQSL